MRGDFSSSSSFFFSRAFAKVFFKLIFNSPLICGKYFKSFFLSILTIFLSCTIFLKTRNPNISNFIKLFSPLRVSERGKREREQKNMFWMHKRDPFPYFFQKQVTYKNNVNISSCLCLSSVSEWERERTAEIWKYKPQSFLVSRTMNLFLIDHFFSFMLIYYFYIPFYYHEIIMKLKNIFQFDVIGFERERILYPLPSFIWFLLLFILAFLMSDHYYYYFLLHLLVFLMFVWVNLLWFKLKKGGGGCNYIIILKSIPFFSRIVKNFI